MLIQFYSLKKKKKPAKENTVLPWMPVLQQQHHDRQYLETHKWEESGKSSEKEVSGDASTGPSSTEK